ncbi:MAG TPA: LysM peptidoglycan-binding domain-containing protein [Lacipirellulaceae bacterium]|nr:LysM peptidoglycan-binding domain-containing protein [Lacipirellulaceae bacterium]
MSSIRPLVTITILVVVGAFLYVKINEGPVAPPVPGADESAQAQTPDGVPPLATASSAQASDANTAPLWPASAAAVPPVTAATSSDETIPATDTLAPPLAAATTAANDIAAGTPPAVPAIPELPAMPTGTDATVAAATDALPFANGLPATIPSARYPDPNDATANVVDVMAPQTSAQSVAPTTATTGAAAADSSAVSSPTDSNLLGSSDALAQSPNPLRSTGTPQDVINPNSATIDAVSGTVAAPPAASFAESWPAIQSALERGDLAQAHELLSPYHGAPSLSPVESKNVERLLGQLAGTVIYSTEHRLQPARIVKPGETLETIAKEYNVPWQLLAKINGIPAANQIRPGQELKVVPGPFSAVVDLRRSELTLQVAGRYAGKFPVTVPVGAAVSEGEWLVDQKLVAPASGVTQSAYTTAPPKVDYAIVLRGSSEPAATTSGPTLAIASNSNPTGAGDGAAAIQLSPADAEELSDILSVGSRVVIRR